ncbi:MAG: hypothetical protein HY952_10315 [Elusimicrobia bacterium]|nr:hypothetical protein [Elusimicrobiota bacterium]
MKKLTFLLAAAALCGCASFNSGDIKVRRETAAAMLADREITPFADVQVSWRVFPYRAPTDSIGEGSISRPTVIKPVQAEPGAAADFAELARQVFGEAGLYDQGRGRGALRLELTTLGKWTYGDLFKSFLVDTGFIFIIPASLRENYYLTADFAAPEKQVRVETEGTNKTTFHLLMMPLYPFAPPGRKETSLLRQMLWRSATDVYTRLKAAGGVPAELPKAAAKNEPAVPMPGPPLPPDRTWLPGQGPADNAAGIVPEKPDNTWVVPESQKKDGQPVTQPSEPIKPAEASRSWLPPPAPTTGTAPAAAPAPQETPDD